ncbi:MAG: alpha/beta fold hydrolase [Ilumatobacter sp.]
MVNIGLSEPTMVHRVDASPRHAEAPPLPPGRPLRLPGRGTTFIREIAGPPAAPTLMLLHGWGSTADLNWHRCYHALGQRFRVIALDHRGHGRGLDTRQRFRLEDCADDAVAVADALGVDRFIPVGYSMGGPIASLVWKRRPERVGGLIMCATSRRFNETRSKRAGFTILKGTSTLASVGPFRSIGRLSGAAWSRRLERRGDAAWTVEQVLRHDWTQVLAAGHAIGRFDSTEWIGDVDVPSAVIVTRGDEIVPTHDQLGLADAVPTASVQVIDGGHTACSAAAGHFVPALLNACTTVTQPAAISA